ncbi:MAG: EI24 domain-containing protein [Planctomycetota bacterium]
MLDAFSRAIGQLFERRILGVIGACVGLALACCVVVFLGATWLVASFRLVDYDWLQTAINWLGGFAALVLTWFLFPLLVSAFIGLFLETVARAVEAKHYPDLPKAPGLPVAQAVLASARYLGLVVVVNALLLLLLFLGPVYAVGYYLANGFLLSREYFDLVALRRATPAEARLLRGRHGMPLLLMGIATAFLLTLPFVQFVAPVIATAAMVHRFEDWRRGLA